MTKEQEEAIERCKELIKEAHAGWIGISNQKAIKTILSMLEEISQLKKGINSLMLSRGKWKNRYYKTRNKLKEKDKQIDLMSEFIAQTEIDEFICKDIEHCIADDEYSNCYKCIEQYFENKVKES